MCKDDIRNSNRKNNIIRWFGLSYIYMDVKSRNGEKFDFFRTFWPTLADDNSSDADVASDVDRGDF